MSCLSGHCLLLAFILFTFWADCAVLPFFCIINSLTDFNPTCSPLLCPPLANVVFYYDWFFCSRLGPPLADDQAWDDNPNMACPLYYDYSMHQSSLFAR